MRILLSKKDKLKLFTALKEKCSCDSMLMLSRKMNISLRTLQNWIYLEKRYIPESMIPEEIKNKIIVIDRQEDNWGKIKGGKKTYINIVEKYGSGEIKRRQSKGGKAAGKSRWSKEKPFSINKNNNMFLEFYGVLLGDGWLSKLKYDGKDNWLIGISGDGKLDREFFIYLKKNIKELFNRAAYLKERPKYNSIELNFSHKMLIRALNENIGFPLGKKINLKIDEEVYNLGYEKVKQVIRGIFDTDGSFYLDKTSAGKPYPCICITMKAPILIKQIYDMLVKEGFKVYHNKHRSPNEQIILKGSKQLKKWMKEIGSSNPRHLRKIKAL